MRLQPKKPKPIGNTGDGNNGDFNAGNHNAGHLCTGDNNAGDGNAGFWNVGYKNTGDRNRGNGNVGDYNLGDCNVGSHNIGNRNIGNYNTGDRNVGHWNSGSYNTGDWNTSSFNTGCFNTEEKKLTLFNKPSDWSYTDWMCSDARGLLNMIPKFVLDWVPEERMSPAEKRANPKYLVTGGYLRILNESECAQYWWDRLPEDKRQIIRSIPNFDAEIFYECTGIRVRPGVMIDEDGIKRRRNSNKRR